VSRNGRGTGSLEEELEREGAPTRPTPWYVARVLLGTANHRAALLSLALAAVGAALVPNVARAEASAWASVSGGAAGLKSGGDPFTLRGLMQFDAGVGTSPANPFIFGTIFRVTPMIKEGTDLSLSLRGATRGFQIGDWGFAVGLGAYLRTFNPLKPPITLLPTTGFVGGVVLGGPFGTQVTVLGHYGMNTSYGVTACLGIDILRLTVYRQSALQWWPNPMSAGARTALAQ
jgi:hypothetical protein